MSYLSLCTKDNNKCTLMGNTVKDYGDFGYLEILVININLSILRICKTNPSIINTISITSVLYIF